MAYDLFIYSYILKTIFAFFNTKENNYIYMINYSEAIELIKELKNNINKTITNDMVSNNIFGKNTIGYLLKI